MKRYLFMAFFILIFNQFSFAQTELEPEAFVICKLHSHVRTIAVHKKGDSYETVYSKFGKAQVIGSGRSIESNKGFLGNVRTNLEKSGWNCREVKEASVVRATGES